ncbi:hypothetical protein D9611_013928 [Ephemerocybe angulata]|uniref:F-box domain-containing protein n=1 Tax=Ephemerocybe angulata TaxID=980116 RepID=A0A8H5B9J9_9AGAR|nr:hypothetical protein D9611_013928 [Tulosesus angulatus]
MELHKRSIFDILPLELLELIVKRNLWIRTLRELRLVSRAMKDLVDPLTFSSTTLSFEYVITPEQLRYIASGTSPNTRWTKRLHIEDLLPIEGPEYLDEIDTFGPGRLAAQKAALVPAIRALKEVTQVEFDLNGDGPYINVVTALAGLPKLRILRMNGGEFRRQKVAAFSRISNLEDLHINSVEWSSGTRKAARRMIAASLPTLRELHLEQFRQNNLVELSKILPAESSAESLPPALPLTKFCLYGERFIADSSCAHYFRNLTHLEMCNVGKAIAEKNAPFWDALAESNVRLHSLLAYPLTSSLTRYLTSYAGLFSLRVEGQAESVEYYHRTEGEVSLAQSFVRSAIPHHRATLQRLSFVTLDYRAWALTEDTLNCIATCKKLERVDLIYHFPREMQDDLSYAFGTPFIDMSHLLSRLLDGLNLPNLHTVILSPAREPDKAFGTCVRSFDDIIPFLAAWQRLVRQVDLTSLSHSQVLNNPRFRLYAASGDDEDEDDGPDMVFDVNTGHFRPHPAQDWNRDRSSSS